ncbi:Uncharacterised protein [Mycobacteroides abscessus subsp. massiliense]|nr:Uncharacterised protein [Mycobacteroides abscessus subsp. massiliense]
MGGIPDEPALGGVPGFNPSQHLVHSDRQRRNLISAPRYRHPPAQIGSADLGDARTDRIDRAQGAPHQQIRHHCGNHRNDWCSDRQHGCHRRGHRFDRFNTATHQHRVPAFAAVNHHRSHTNIIIGSSRNTHLRAAKIIAAQQDQWLLGARVRTSHDLAAGVDDLHNHDSLIGGQQHRLQLIGRFLTQPLGHRRSAGIGGVIDIGTHRAIQQHHRHRTHNHQTGQHHGGRHQR